MRFFTQLAIVAATFVLPVIGNSGAAEKLAGRSIAKIVPHSIDMERLRQKAAAGDISAQFQLGMIFREGIGVNRDPNRAKEYLLGCAQRGLAEAQTALAEIYARVGRYQEAVHWFKLAAEQGSAGAQYGLAQIYEEGRGGIPQDFAYALSWYEEAARNGHPSARAHLKKISMVSGS